MPQPTDIVLNNAGYMVQPGSPQSPGYKRLQDGYPEGLTQRTSLTDFFGGLRRSHQLERDRAYNGLAVKPTLNGQGVAPQWGASYSSSLTALTDHQPTLTSGVPSIIVRDRLYFAIGPNLIAGPATQPPGSTFGFTILKTYTHTITDLTIYGSIGILIAFGSAADIVFRHTVTNVETVLFTGERAHRIEAYAGYAIWSDARAAATPTILRMVKGVGIDSRHVSYDVTAMTTVGGNLMLITKNALFTFSGRVQHTLVANPNYPTQPNPQIPAEQWLGEFTPFYQQGIYTDPNDFAFITGYGGRTIAWIAGGIHEHVPSGDRAGWRSTGLTGKRCFGGTVAAGYVIVAIESHDNQNELWAWDGNGWWCIARRTITATGNWCWPVALGESATNQVQFAGYHIAVFSDQVNQITLFRLKDPEPIAGVPYYAYPTQGHIITPLIDTGDRDKIKAWRKIGAVFSSPERFGNLTSTDDVDIALDYSIDAGETWVQAATQTLTNNTLANMNIDLEAALSGVMSRYIMLRVRWNSVSNWAPILTGLWVEHETFNSPARRRKWQLRIHARDQEIDRDGVLLTRTGRQLIEDLWTAWETDTPMTFRDIDYDTDPTQRTVRIVGISEAATQPFDHGQWGDSLITLNLVEV